MKKIFDKWFKKENGQKVDSSMSVKPPTKEEEKNLSAIRSFTSFEDDNGGKSYRKTNCEGKNGLVGNERFLDRLGTTKFGRDDNGGKNKVEKSPVLDSSLRSRMTARQDDTVGKGAVRGGEKVKMNKREMATGLVAVATCLVVFFSFLGGIFVSSKDYSDSTLNGYTGGTATATPITSSTGKDYYPSILNLTTAGANVATNFQNNLLGYQQDYIYYGTNPSSDSEGTSGTPIKWRVLSNSDTRYSSNKVLLWSDYRIAKNVRYAGTYGNSNAQLPNATYSYNVNLAYYGVSYLRAYLNPGSTTNSSYKSDYYYLSGLSTGTSASAYNVLPTSTNFIQLTSATLYDTIFGTTEKNGIVKTGKYYTVNYGDNNIAAARYLYTVDTADATGNASYTGYSTSLINSMNTLMSGYNNTTTVSYTNNTSGATGNKSVVEECSGDSMFVLDYLDINNIAYGMGDNIVFSNGVPTSAYMYADKAMTQNAVYKAGQLGSSGTYGDEVTNLYNGSTNLSTTTIYAMPWNYMGGATADFTLYHSDYLKYSDYTSNDDYSYYWLRNTGHTNVVYGVAALMVTMIGQVNNYYVSAQETRGVRPAFNLEPANVIYATAGDLPTDNTLAGVSALRTVDGTQDTKPAYKVYLKSASYENYNDTKSVTPTIKVRRVASTSGYDYYLDVTNTAQKNKRVVVLLADKDNSGAVEYMASTSLNDDGLGTVKIPSGVNVANYSITTLFADTLTTDSDSSSLSTETITASYVADSTVIPNPTDYETTYIAGVFDTAAKGFGSATWFNPDDYAAPSGSTANVTVVYKESGNDKFVDGYPYNVGTYSAIFTLNNNCTWSDGTNGAITVTFKVTKKDLVVEFNTDTAKIYGYSPGIKSGLCAGEARSPNLLVKFVDDSNTSKIYYSDTYPSGPTKRGTYTMSIVLDTNDSLSGNYNIKTNDSKSYTRGPDEVTTPKLTENVSGSQGVDATAKHEYKGQSSPWIFPVANLDTSQTNIKVLYTPPSKQYTDNNVTSSVYSSGVMSFTNAGTYTVTFSLKGNASTDTDADCQYVWDDGKKTCKEITETVVIEQFTPTLTFGPLGFESGWDASKQKEVDVETTVFSGDNMSVKLTFTYTTSTDSGKNRTFTGLKLALDSTSNKMTAKQTGISLSYGKYDIDAELEKSGDYENYDIVNSKINYSGLEVAAAPAGTVVVQWVYSDGTTTKQGPIGDNSSGDPYKAGSYNGSVYSFKIDDSILPTGIVIDSSSNANSQQYVYNTVSGNADTSHKNAGVYTVSVTLKSNDPSIAFTATTYTLKFEIVPLQFDLSNVSWDYKSFTYDGNAKTVNIQDVDKATAWDSVAGTASTILPSSGLTAKVSGDTTKTNAANNYKASVTFSCADANFEAPVDTPAGGTQNYNYSGSTGTTFDFDLTWAIDKAKLDLSNVKWNWEVKNFTYTGQTQTVKLFESGDGTTADEIAAELPAGLIAKYSGNRQGKLTTDTDTATVSFSLSPTTYTNADGTTGTYSDNYIVPDMNDAATYIDNSANGFSWSLTWTIGPAEINATWMTYSVQDKNGNYYQIAVLQDDNGDPILDKNLDPSSNSVVEYTYYTTSDCDPANEIKFADIEVDVGNGIKSYYAKATVTKINQGTYKITGTDVESFQVGDTRLPVTIAVTGNVYNTQPQAANINITVTGNGVVLSDLIVDYFETTADRTANTNQMKSMPINAGDYYLKVALNTTKSNDFVIVGSTSFTYTISKKQLDVTNIKWDYDAANPYEYTLKGGVEQVYEVKLTGYTDTELDNMFIYSDNKGSSVYSYTKTKYEITMTADERINYELVSIDATGNATVLTDADVYKICPQSLSWDIVARQLVKPADNNLTFDDLDHDLLAMSGIDANTDWSEYLTLTITKDGDPYEDAVGNVNTVAHYAGTYTLTFAFNAAAATNAGWAKGDGTVDHYNVTVNCVVDKLTLTLTGWKNNPPEPKFDGTVGSNFYQVVYEKVSDGTKMDRATALTCEGEACIAYVEPATGLEDSVVVAAQTPMIPLQKPYKYSSTAPEYLTKPTLKAEVADLSYTGNTLSIMDYLDNFDADKMEISGDISVVNAGEYSVVIGIKDSVNAYWQGEDNWDSFSLTYDVNKRVIKIDWNTTGKVPVLNLPDDAAVDYKYYDEQGNEVTRENMVNDGEYTVVANLTSDTSTNNLLEDDSTQVAVLTDMATDDFKYIYHTFLNLGFWEVDPDFPCVQLVIILFCLIITVLCFVKGGFNIKAAKKLQSETDEKFGSGEGGDDSSTDCHGGLLVGGIAVGGILASGGTMIWTILAVVAIAIMLFAVIFLIISSKKQGSARSDAKKAEKEFKKKAAEAEKRKAEEEKKAAKEQAEAERLQKEKEEREEERRQQLEERKLEKEEQQAERKREREAEEQKQMMMMMMMKGGSSGGSGGGGGYCGGGGTTVIPYPAPTYAVPPVQNTVTPAQSDSDDIVAKVVAAIQPTIQGQQQQLTAQQVKDLEEKINLQSQQLNQHQQDDRVKALEEQLAKHQQEQQSQQQDQKFKALEDKIAQQQEELAKHRDEQLEQQKLADQQEFTRQQIMRELAAKKDSADELSRQDEERNQEFTKYMLDRSNRAAREAEDRRNQQEQDQLKALEEQIQLQKRLIEELRTQKQESNGAKSDDKTDLLIELLQRNLMAQSGRQTDDQTKHFEETLKKQEQLIEELRLRNQKTDKNDSYSPTIEQLLLMLQKQQEQQKIEQDNKLAKQQAELTQKMYEQQVLRQQEMQAQQQDQSRQQIKALEEQLAKQKEEQAKLLEQQKLEQEKLLEKQRVEQEKKLEEIKNQKDQAELLAELRSQREPVKQDDTTSKILEEHSKTLEQIAKQQAEMQAKQQMQEQERLRQEQENKRKELEQKIQEQAEQIKELKAKNSTVPTNTDNTAKILEEHSKTLEQITQQQEAIQTKQQEQEQDRLLQEHEAKRKELEQKIQEQADEIKELKAKNSTVPTDADKTAEILEEHSKTIEQITKKQADLQEQQRANEEAQRQKELEDIIKDQARELEFLKSQTNQPVATAPQGDDRIEKILEQHSRTLEKITQHQLDLQEQQRAKEDAQRRKEQEDAERQRGLENLIREQSKLLEELKNQPAPVVTPQPDEKTARILEQQSRTLEEQGKAIEEQGRTLEQIARQQDKAFERLSQQQTQKPAESTYDTYPNQYQNELRARELAEKQAELQTQQLARQQAEFQARELAEQNARQQALLDQQARQLAQQQNQAELNAQEQAKIFERQLQQLQQTQQTESLPNQDELKKDNLTKK